MISFLKIRSKNQWLIPSERCIYHVYKGFLFWGEGQRRQSSLWVLKSNDSEQKKRVEIHTFSWSTVAGFWVWPHLFCKLWQQYFQRKIISLGPSLVLFLTVIGLRQYGVFCYMILTYNVACTYITNRNCWYRVQCRWMNCNFSLALKRKHVGFPPHWSPHPDK